MTDQKKRKKHKSGKSKFLRSDEQISKKFVSISGNDKK